MAKRARVSSTGSIGTRRSDETFRQIVALIFEGHFSPGSPLPPERELAETLNVSRPTLREALNRLEARGYVERRSKSGNYVCTAIPTSLREPIQEVLEQNLMPLTHISDVRKILEVWAVEKAVEDHDHAHLENLRKCLDVMNSEVACNTEEQFARYRTADQQFHQILAQMTGNVLYVHLAHFLTDLVSRSISLSRLIFPGDYPGSNLLRHERIFEALRDHDSQKARDAMLDHFEHVERYLSSRKQSRSRLRAPAL